MEKITVPEPGHTTTVEVEMTPMQVLTLQAYDALRVITMTNRHIISMRRALAVSERKLASVKAELRLMGIAGANEKEREAHLLLLIEENPDARQYNAEIDAYTDAVRVAEADLEHARGNLSIVKREMDYLIGTVGRDRVSREA